MADVVYRAEFILTTKGGGGDSRAGHTQGENSLNQAAVLSTVASSRRIDPDVKLKIDNLNDERELVMESIRYQTSQEFTSLGMNNWKHPGDFMDQMRFLKENNQRLENEFRDINLRRFDMSSGIEDLTQEVALESKSLLKKQVGGVTAIVGAAQMVNNIRSEIQSNTQTIHGDFIGAANTARSTAINNYWGSKALSVGTMFAIGGPIGGAVGLGAAGISMGIDVIKHSQKVRMYDAQNNIQNKIYEIEGSKLSTSARRFRS